MGSTWVPYFLGHDPIVVIRISTTLKGFCYFFKLGHFPPLVNLHPQLSMERWSVFYHFCLFVMRTLGGPFFLVFLESLSQIGNCCCRCGPLKTEILNVIWKNINKQVLTWFRYAVARRCRALAFCWNVSVVSCERLPWKLSLLTVLVWKCSDCLWGRRVVMTWNKACCHYEWMGVMLS